MSNRSVVLLAVVLVVIGVVLMTLGGDSNWVERALGSVLCIGAVGLTGAVLFERRRWGQR